MGRVGGAQPAGAARSTTAAHVHRDLPLQRALRDANAALLAIQAYHRDTGAYPATLAALTPKYLTAEPTVPDLAYDRDTGSLAYHYTPSWPQLRPVWCRSVGDTTEWQCEEHVMEGL